MRVLPRASAGGGMLWGLVGVVAFSFTVPFTRVAVGGLPPLFVGTGRAVVAAVLAGLALGVTRQRLPRGRWRQLVVVAAGVVIGFPLFTSFALRTVPANHAAVVIALLPAATAAMAVLRGHERPPVRFWVLALAGALATVAFIVAQGGGGIGSLQWADLLLLGAVASAAIGYAEGALVARHVGAWQTVSWALVLCAPVMVVLAVWSADGVEFGAVGAPQWAAFAYLGVVSMFLGFFAWYRGLAIGPTAQVSQVQLVQPVLSITWAALLLGETITPATVIGGAVVVLLAGAAARTRAQAPPVSQTQ